MNDTMVYEICKAGSPITYVVAHMGTWVTGVYAGAGAARMAPSVPVDALHRLWVDEMGRRGAITYEQLKSLEEQPDPVIQRNVEQAWDNAPCLACGEPAGAALTTNLPLANIVALCVDCVRAMAAWFGDTTRHPRRRPMEPEWWSDVKRVLTEAGRADLLPGLRTMLEDVAELGGPQSPGAALIAQERRRQVEAEGYTPDHDDGHRYADLAVVAAALAVFGSDATVVDPVGRVDQDTGEDVWGLVKKHGDDVTGMVVAGALIAAEIDRMLRAGRT